MIEYGYNSIIVRNPNKDTKEFERFHKRLSVWDKGRFKFVNPVYYEFNNDIFIPYTIGIDTIKYYFKKEKSLFNPSLITKARDIKFNMVNNPKTELQEK